MFLPDDGTIVGEVGLYPRSAAGRVPYDQADSVELGYWLRADRTGQGYVTEGSVAMLELAPRLTRVSRIEVRCDARNATSAAIPQRLGFALANTLHGSGVSGDEPVVHLQVWMLTIR
jgi:RimJ/RimL family protein N-acetyltransferase